MMMLDMETSKGVLL